MFSLLFCIIAFVCSIEIELGKTYSGQHNPWRGESKYTLYDLPISKIIPDRQLILVVKQLTSFSNPDIFVSTTVTEPTEFTAEIKCQSQGMDICLIDDPEVTTYHISIYCEGYCRFSFKAVYQEEFQMGENDDLEFKITDWTQAIDIKVNNVYSTSPQTLEILVKAKNIDVLDEAFKTYLNIGKSKPSTEKSDYKGSETFSGTQIFKIQNINSGNDFSLLIECEQGTIFIVQTRLFGTIRNIELGDKIEDYVNDGEFQFYRLNLTQESKHQVFDKNYLNIQLVPFKGYAELYVHFDQQPPFLSSYTWSSKDKINEDLVITSEDLKKYNFKGEFAYIAVQGKELNASYELKTQFIDPKYMVLELNKPTTGKLLQGKNIQYEFYIQSKIEQTVSVSLKNIKGDADIILKQCKNLQQCKISDEEIENKNQLVNSTFGDLFVYSEQPGNDIISFDNLPNSCKEQGNTFVCFYVICIHEGNQNKDSELTYSILVTTKSQTIELKENTPIKQIVSKELYNYYKFTITPNDEIRRMMVIITPIQGQPQLYMSKLTDTPGKESFEQQGSQNSIGIGGRDSRPEPATYYIGVYGVTSAQYIITVVVFRQFGDWNLLGKYPNQYILLLEGEPFEINTNEKSPSLFKLDLTPYYDPTTKYHQPVDVLLRINQGQFKIYAFDHPEIDISKSIYNGTSAIQLNSSFEKYPQYLYLRIEPDGQFNYYSYQIYFRIQNQPIELVIGNNYQGFILSKEPQLFFVNYYKDEELQITKHIDNHDQSLLKANVKVLSTQKNIDQIEETLVLSKEELNLTNCQNEALKSITKCQLQIMLTSFQDSYFSLIITRDSTIIQLFDGEPVTRQISDSFDHFVFQSTLSETEIAVFSLTGEVRILVSILDHYPTISEFPTNNTNAQYQSLRDQFEIGSSVFLSEEQFLSKGCDKKICYVAISCVKAESKYSNEGQYQITRSSTAIPLQEGSLFVGSVNKNHIRYFKTKLVEGDEGFMVVATPLNMGTLLLLVSQNEMPTIDTHDQSSSTIIGDQLIVKRTSIYEKTTYYIGVYSFEYIEFSIQINIGDLSFYHIKRSYPFNVILKPYSKTYLNYFHPVDQSFNILFTTNIVSDYGKPQISIHNYQNSSMQQQVLTTNSKEFYWHPTKLVQSITKKDAHYCVDCNYLILIENNYQEVDITVTIHQEGDSLNLIDNLEQTNMLQFGDHFYRYHANSNFFINLTISKGIIDVYGGFFLTNQNINKVLLNNFAVDSLGNKNNKSIFINITNLGDEEQQALNIYKIKVVAKSEAVYSIECISAKQAVELKVGESQQTTIGSNDKAIYYFVVPDLQDNKGPYSLTIQEEGQSFQKRQQNGQHPRISLRQDLQNNIQYDSTNHKFKNVEFTVQNTTEFISYYEFNGNPGLYFVEIRPKESSVLPYFITLGNSDINTLVPRLTKYVTSKIGFLRKWELNLVQKTQVYLQVQLCGGIVHLLAGPSLEQLERNNYEYKMDYAHNKQLHGQFVVQNTGQYYLTSKLVRSFQNESQFGSYMITAYFLKEDTILPYQKFEPGDDGQISSRYDGNQITVYFTSIRNNELSSQDYKVTGIFYYFAYEHKSISDETPLYQCNIGVQYKTLYHPQEQVKYDQSLSIVDIIGKDFEKITYTIMARVFIKTNNGEDLSFDYFYNLENLVSDNASTLFLIKDDYRKAIITVILVILLMSIVLLIIKNRKLQSIWKYDPSFVAQQQGLVPQEGGIEMNSSNYSNLRSQ